MLVVSPRYVVYSVILTDPRPGLWRCDSFTAHMHKWPGPFYARKPEVSLEVGKVRLTYPEQLDLLKRRGMLIEDEVEAIAILSRVNYYRLSGYFRYWQLDPEHQDDSFIDGTSFGAVYRLYEMERLLSHECSMLLASCEIFLRNRFAYHYAEHFAPVASYAHGKGFSQPPSCSKEEPVQERILSDLDRSNDQFVVHYRDEITSGTASLPQAYDRMPIWVAVEVLSFGTLSRMIQASGESHVLDSIVAAPLSMSRSHFPSQVRSFVYLRNRCSHFNRLWNITVSDAPALNRNIANRIKRNYRTFDERSIYKILAVMHHFVQNAGICENWLGTRIEPLLQANPLLAYGIATPKKYGEMPRDVLIDAHWQSSR